MDAFERWWADGNATADCYETARAAFEAGRAEGLARAADIVDDTEVVVIGRGYDLGDDGSASLLAARNAILKETARPPEPEGEKTCPHCWTRPCICYGDPEPEGEKT